MTPDGYNPPSPGETHRGTVWQYHGVYFHGYPPEHPNHESYVFNGAWGPAKYAETIEKMQRYKNAGYRVRYAWSCDYMQTRRRHAPISLESIVHDF